MKQDRAIRAYLNQLDPVPVSRSALRKTTHRAAAAFYAREETHTLSRAEFLFQQSRFIQKRWWAMQALVLLALMAVLRLSGVPAQTQRCMGMAACGFAVLLLPELWRNRDAGAMEVECAACFGLRQIYAARLLLCALADLSLLTAFSAAALYTGCAAWHELLIQFLLPYTVSCCICFQCLYSRRHTTPLFSCFLCGIWYLFWMQIVLNEPLYRAVSVPVWCALLTGAAGFLVFCICRGQTRISTIWEAKPLWN